MDWGALAAILTAIAAVIASIGQYLSSRQTAAAKDETLRARDEVIRAKDAQIETLKSQIVSLQELTPMKIREYFVSTKEQLEEYNNTLLVQVQRVEETLAEKDAEIAHLHNDRTVSQDEIRKLEDERRMLQNEVEELKGALQDVQRHREVAKSVRRGLSARQKAILAFVENYVERNNVPPTIRDIAEGLDISSIAVVDYNIKRLQELGFVQREYHIPSGWASPRVVFVPVEDGDAA